MTRQEKTPELYLSMPHPCGYLPGKIATMLFIDPHDPPDATTFNRFTLQGFRRSGELVYRPHCHGCAECTPVRVPVRRFQPNRGQRRAQARNRDVEITRCEPVFSQEHFELYRRYQAQRHGGGGMDDPNPQKYLQFLVHSQVDTAFYEMRTGGRLLAVAVADHLPDALSAVYTFFDPDEKTRGLGVYAVLWEIARARELNLEWLYLGYWIRENTKMAYKSNYRPLEAYRRGRWTELLA
jgi:arginine-tRNA-protein transferase